MTTKIPPQRHRDISHRAYHKKLVAFENPRQPTGCCRLIRRKPTTLSASPFAVGQESEEQGVYLKQVSRKPPRWFLTNDHMVNTVLAKQPKGQRGWDLMLPKGGVHSFKKRRKAIEFASRLAPVSEACREPTPATPASEKGSEG